MKVTDLIAALQAAVEAHGEDVEVQLATQPHYPFYNSIAGVTSSEDVYESEEDSDEAIEEAGNSPVVIYILEGGQLGYGSRNAWNGPRF